MYMVRIEIIVEELDSQQTTSPRERSWQNFELHSSESPSLPQLKHMTSE